MITTEISIAADSYALSFGDLPHEMKVRLREAVLYGVSLSGNTEKRVDPSEEITDSHFMPFGKYKGKKMVDVPAVYLVWLFDNGCSHAGVKKYIVERYQVLKQEAAKAKR